MRWTFASLLWLSLIVVRPCAAQPADELQALFEAGNAALREGRFPEARDLLRRALAMEPRVGTAFNLGVALRGTGEVVECATVFDAVVEGEFGDAPDALRGHAERLREECAADRARLTLSVSGPDEATVDIDGGSSEAVRAGETLERWIDPGRHVLTAGAAGFERENVVVELGRGETRALSVELRPVTPPATLVLRTDAQGGELEITDVARGPSPLTRAVPPGSYELRLHLAGSVADTSRVTLASGERREVSLSPPSSVLEEPWLWILVGAVALGAAAGLVVGFVVYEPGVAPPAGNALFPDPLVVP